MVERGPNDDDVNAREAETILAESMKDAGREPVSESRARRFYDRIRANITSYLSRKGKKAGRAQDFLLLAPDVFILLWRLTRDERVAGKHKVLLGTAIAYFIFPLDIMPEAIFGPIGFLDDLVLGVYVLNRMLADTDEQILRDHWSGSEDVLAMIRRVIRATDDLVATDVVKAVKKIVK
ncbi:MAG TPA: DUF1232 domain-containing protein [Thermoanaerobaculia bacterium]|nr:DUF1232 domain-containing protein [Thermoanaerobaculia bacterium]